MHFAMMHTYDLMPCPVCGREIQNSYRLKTHLGLVHPEEKDVSIPEKKAAPINAQAGTKGADGNSFRCNACPDHVVFTNKDEALSHFGTLHTDLTTNT
jgi:hypothetical protein